MSGTPAWAKKGLTQNQPLISRSTLGRLITASQVLADFFAVVLSFLLAQLIYLNSLKGSSSLSLNEYLFFSCVVGLLYVFVLAQTNSYRREISLLNIKELRGIFRTGILSAALLLVLAFYFRPLYLSRVSITLAIVITPFVLCIERMVFQQIHMVFHRKGWSRKKVVVYGAGEIGLHLVKRMFQSPSLGLLPIGLLDDDTSRHGQKLTWPGRKAYESAVIIGGESLISQLKEHGVEAVFIALPSATFSRNQQLVDLCLEANIEYCIVPNVYEKFIQNIELFEIGGIPILRRRERKNALLYGLVKRGIDFSLSAVLLIALLPLFLLLALIIRIDSKGPSFFRQKRVGLGGVEFELLKFRSMYVDAPKYALTPESSLDPRITRVGRWLRRTSFDELPQLINVLKGEMSLVGPRPEMPFIVQGYTSLQRKRLEAKPGITGVWQIGAARGEPIHANIEYDLFYLDNRSTLFDVAILFKTFVSVIRGIGAV